MDNEKSGSAFWKNLEENVESELQKARGENRAVSGLSIAWHLFLSPLMVFAKTFFLAGGIFNGRAGIRSAVHRSVLLFMVNTRLYEIEKGDSSPLTQIRKEWLEPGSRK